MIERRQRKIYFIISLLQEGIPIATEKIKKKVEYV